MDCAMVEAEGVEETAKVKVESMGNLSFNRAQDAALSTAGA